MVWTVARRGVAGAYVALGTVSAIVAWRSDGVEAVPMLGDDVFTYLTIA